MNMSKCAHRVSSSAVGDSLGTGVSELWFTA
jgi:hypothetical protein